jgi:hypothetical protein
MRRRASPELGRLLARALPCRWNGREPARHSWPSGSGPAEHQFARTELRRADSRCADLGAGGRSSGRVTEQTSARWVELARRSGTVPRLGSLGQRSMNRRRLRRQRLARDRKRRPLWLRSRALTIFWAFAREPSKVDAARAHASHISGRGKPADRDRRRAVRLRTRHGSGCSKIRRLAFASLNLRRGEPPMIISPR